MEAQFNLFEMYRNGRGVPQDFAKAMRWYKKAAEQGDDQAQFNLGVMYKDGQGVPQDHTAAAKWYRKAAEQGLADGLDKLGFLYGNGLGVAQDYIQAHMWWNLAAAQGNKISAKNRNIVAKRMTPADISKAKKMAREWKPKK